MATVDNEVTIAGVQWPLYKVAALVVGLVAALVVGVVTMNPAPAVLGGAAAGTLTWIVLGTVARLRP
jgi:hypothetical protein